MTREEAIEVIEQDIPCEHDTDLIEALEMAIKALEQEPCEDTVSRKEIIEHYTTGEMANVHHIDKNHLLAFVEQLPPVRPQPCEDAISREDAIAEINDTIARYIPLFYGRTVKIPLELDRAIMRVPPVRPQEPKTGHWIRQDNTKEPLYGWYFCSECNSVIGDKTKFCSNCGCRMVEPQERSDKE